MKRILTLLLLSLLVQCHQDLPAVTTNTPPIARVGDRAIALPDNAVMLDGRYSTDQEQNVVNYAWTKIGGPSSYSIVNPKASYTQIYNLVQGTYEFQLTVTDREGLFAKDTARVAVTAPQTACEDNTRPKVTARLIPVGQLSQARSGMAVTAVGSKLLFAGADVSLVNGLTQYGSSQVDLYDVITQTWSTAQLSKARMDIAAVAAGNKVFFAGGRLGNEAFDQVFSTVDIYDVVTNSWSVASLSEACSPLGAATLGHRVFFACGQSVNIYDLSTNNWSNVNLSRPRSAIAVVSANSRVYFGGGKALEGLSSRIDIFDTSTNSWSTSRLMAPKSGVKGIAAGNKIYWYEKGNCSVEIRDLTTQNSSVEYLSKAGSEQAILTNTKILFFRSGNFDIYDPATQSWSIGQLPVLIDDASYIVVNNTVYIAGGWVDGALSRQVWKLEF